MFLPDLSSLGTRKGLSLLGSSGYRTRPSLSSIQKQVCWVNECIFKVTITYPTLHCSALKPTKRFQFSLKSPMTIWHKKLGKFHTMNNSMRNQRGLESWCGWDIPVFQCRFWPLTEENDELGFSHCKSKQPIIQRKLNAVRTSLGWNFPEEHV